MRTFITFILPFFVVYAQEIVISPDSTQNAAKRFTLQDLVGLQGGGVSQQPQSLPDQEMQATSAKTQTVDIQTLIEAAQKAGIQQQQQQQQQTAPQVVQPPPEALTSKFTNKPIDIDLEKDKNGNYNFANIPGVSKSNNEEPNTISLSDLQALNAKPQAEQTHVVKEELELGKEKIELEAAGKRTTHYTLVKGPDGGLNLVPVVEGASAQPQMLQPKGYEEAGKSRQQMQLTTLSQALYSPFPSDQNTLHLHLKGKDGKDGKSGNKGSMGHMGPKGPEGPRGPKGDAGTCSSQINGLFECTPDELDSLSNRVDYLEKICKKVEKPAKKHIVFTNSTKSAVTNSSKIVDNSNATIATSNDTVTAAKEAEDKAKAEKLKKEQEEKEKKEQEDKERKEKEEKEAKEKGEKEKQQKEKTAKVQEEKAKAAADLASTDAVADKKNLKTDTIENDTHPVVKATYHDPASATLRSMIDVRAKLKIAELDLMDRVRQAKEGTMKDLKH